MSFLDSLLGGSTLKSAINKTVSARKAEGARADKLFQDAYGEFEVITAKYSELAEILYNWGFALLHQAQTKIGEEAIKIYQEANSKFSYCATIFPNHLGSAVDGGVSLMGLARAKEVDAKDPLYELAREKFLTAENIQTGSASYNLACLYGLRGDNKACLEALEKARDNGIIPEVEDILNDADLAGVLKSEWFNVFIKSLEDQPESEASETDGEESEAETEQPAAVEIEQSVPEPKRRRASRKKTVIKSQGR